MCTRIRVGFILAELRWLEHHGLVTCYGSVACVSCGVVVKVSIRISLLLHGRRCKKTQVGRGFGDIYHSAVSVHSSSWFA